MVVGSGAARPGGLVHLLIVDSQAGTGTGHNLAFTGTIIDGARRLGWQVTVVSPHPPAPGPLRWEPVPPAIAPGRSARQARARHRATIAFAGRLAARTGVDLVLDTYLHPELGLPRFPRGTPPRVRLAHHHLRLRTNRVRRWSRRWAPPHVHRLARLAADGDVLAAMTPEGAASIAAQVPGGRTLLVPHPIAVEVAPSSHAVNDPPVLAFPGEPRADKGWPELLAALRLLRHDVELQIISVATSDDLPGSVGRARITWERDVADHRAFVAALGACDAAVLPHTAAFARRGGASSTVLEAFAAGLPVVAGIALRPSVPDDPEVVRLVDPADAAALAAAIDDLVEHLGAARAAARTIGPDHVATHHDATATLQRMVDALGIR